MDSAIEQRQLSPVLRRLLLADAALELLIALVLTGVAGRVHWWLNVERPVTLAAAGLFAIAAAAVGWLAVSRRASYEVVQYIAFANLIGGVAVWAGLVLDWDRFEPEGLWLVAASANAFLIFGVLGAVALRRQGWRG